MGNKEKIAALRQAVEAINERDLAKAAQVVTPGFARHDLADIFPAQKGGSAEVTNFLAALIKAFPDIVWKIQDIFTAGDRGTIRFQFTGTHKADLFGVPPTGQRVEFNGVNVYRFEGDKVAEAWQLWDWAAVFRQIGLLKLDHPK